MKWFLILAATALAAYFVWVEYFGGAAPTWATPMGVPSGGPLGDTAVPDSAAPDAGMPEKVEIKSITPAPKKGEKIYTEEDIRRVGDKAEKDSPKKNPFTNADLKKYHVAPGRPDIEQARKDVQWAEEPAKKPQKK